MQTTLSERIRIILSEKNLKQAELAEALGVSVNYISMLANGKKTNVSLTLAKLVEALYGYPAEWIQSGELPADRSELIRRYAVSMILKMDEHELAEIERYITENADCQG